MIRISLVIAAGFALTASAAYAGPCSHEIAMVTHLLGDRATADPMPIGLQTSETTIAQTPENMLTAAGNETNAPMPIGLRTAVAAPRTTVLEAPKSMAAAAGNENTLDHVKMAKQADAAGDETTCMDHIGKAKVLLGLLQ